MTGPGGADAFRRRVRAWLAGDLPRVAPGAPAHERLAVSKRFQAALYDAGLAGISWPVRYGGQGLTRAEEAVFNEEARDLDLPVHPFAVGLGMCGPTLVDLGTEAQKARYIRPLLRGEEIWCQLFSEPGAGSDLAALQTSAVRDGEHWVIDGQKVWTTVAQAADFGALLARTDRDVPKHEGLTMFVLDMRAPGVTVRPLRDMTGRSPFNEVHLDGVRVPADAVIGAVGAGWPAAVAMLGHERVSVSTDLPDRPDRLSFAALLQLARRRGRHEDPVVRDALVGLFLQEHALRLYNVRLRQEASVGRRPGARGSAAKLASAQVSRHAVDVAGMVAGAEAVAWANGDVEASELSVAITAAPGDGIAGGTNEIQRNILGERVLGLPREPVTDRRIPFRELGLSTGRTS